MGGDRSRVFESVTPDVTDPNAESSLLDFGSNGERSRQFAGDEDDALAFLPGWLAGCASDEPAATAPVERAPPPLGLDSYVPLAPGQIGKQGQKAMPEARLEQLRALGFGDAKVLPNGSVPGDPSEMTQDEFDRMVANWSDMDRGVGLRISGSEDDQASFRQILAKGLLGSAALRSVYGDMFDPDKALVSGGTSVSAGLAMGVGASSLSLGRSQPGVLGDDARDGRVDLDDLEVLSSMPGGEVREQYSREDFLAHIFAEQLHLRDSRMRGREISAEEFEPVHERAIAEGTNATRRERGARPLTDQVGYKTPDGQHRAEFRSGADTLDAFDVIGGNFRR